MVEDRLTEYPRCGEISHQHPKSSPGGCCRGIEGIVQGERGSGPADLGVVLGERGLSWERGVCPERVEVVLRERMLSLESGSCPGRDG